MRAWLVRANVRGRRRLDRWLAHGECAVGWFEVGPLEPGTRRDVLASRIRAAYPLRSDGWVRSSTGNLDRFVNRIQPGDLVVTPDGPDVHVGRITSGPRWVEGSEEAHRREVAWLTEDEPLARTDLSPTAAGKLRSMLTVADLTPVVEELRGHAGG